jgi:hypothetical protein
MMEAVLISETLIYFKETVALYPRRLPSSYLPAREPENSHIILVFN